MFKRRCFRVYLGLKRRLEGLSGGGNAQRCVFRESWDGSRPLRAVNETGGGNPASALSQSETIPTPLPSEFGSSVGENRLEAHVLALMPIPLHPRTVQADLVQGPCRTGRSGQERKARPCGRASEGGTFASALAATAGNEERRFGKATWGTDWGSRNSDRAARDKVARPLRCAQATLSVSVPGHGMSTRQTVSAAAVPGFP